jgi:hypothetical protein
MLGVCFLLWCMGQGPATAERVSATNDIRDNTRTERIVAYERSWLIGGFVHQNSPDALFGGALPLNITAFHGRLSIDGGGVIASARVPISGTQANFMTRLQLHLTNRFALTYWHWSNAHISDSNPGMDAVGVSVRLRGPRGAAAGRTGIITTR